MSELFTNGVDTIERETKLYGIKNLVKTLLENISK
jgi:hypothetical protein